MAAVLPFGGIERTASSCEPERQSMIEVGIDGTSRGRTTQRKKQQPTAAVIVID